MAGVVVLRSILFLNDNALTGDIILVSAWIVIIILFVILHYANRRRKRREG